MGQVVHLMCAVTVRLNLIGKKITRQLRNFCPKQKTFHLKTSVVVQFLKQKMSSFYRKLLYTGFAISSFLTLRKYVLCSANLPKPGLCTTIVDGIVRVVLKHHTQITLNVRTN